MSEGIPYADIIILALVAGFILLRLRSILGQNSGHDFFANPPAQKNEPETPVVQIDKPARAKNKEEEDPYLASLGDGQTAGVIKKIKEKDAQFSATEFMAGARRAFEMVFDAFTKGERETLKMLLSDGLYKDFAGVLEDRDADRKSETTLVSIQGAELTDASLTGSTARLTVKFTSEQVQLVRGPGGEILEGDPSLLHHVEDEWVFERDVTSKSPNWTIIET